MKVASNRRKPFRRRDAVLRRGQSIKITRELFKASGGPLLGIPGMYPIKYWEPGAVVNVFNGEAQLSLLVKESTDEQP